MAQEDLTMKCGAELNFVRQFFRVYFSRGTFAGRSHYKIPDFTLPKLGKIPDFEP